MSDHSCDGEVTGSPGFDYEVIRRPRRKRSAISVSRDLRVRVLLPAAAPEETAHRLVRDQAGWVRRKLADFRAQEPPARRWTSGETLPWLGREYPLSITVSGAGDGSDAACLRRDVWLVRLSGAGGSEEERIARVKAALREAFVPMAREALRQRTLARAARMGLMPALVEVKAYRSRWGSCHADGRIYFNWRIAMAPAFVVDYVVTHELCHLRHRNHSPAFRAMVGRWMPDWKQARAWLRQHGRALEALDA